MHEDMLDRSSPRQAFLESSTFVSIFDPPIRESSSPRGKPALFDMVPKRFDPSSLGKLVFSSPLHKKSKNMGYSITRYFFLFETHFAYASSNNTSKIKKYTELKDLKINVTIEEKPNLKGTQKHTLTLFKSSTQTKLYTEDKELAEKWREHLRKYCIMLNFAKYYEMKDTIGQGANGKVMLAYNYKEEKNYAVKMFDKMKLISQLKGFESIVSEVTNLRCISHKNIVQLYEVYESISNVYLVMEYCEGGELYGRLRQGKIFTERECSIIMKSTLEALHYLHDKKIVHRDIKPDNLMMTSKASDVEVKIIDLGFATDLTKPTMMKRCGTPGYIAPEILNTKTGLAITPSVDLFSLGAVFYQLLVGTKLFSGNTIEEILKKNKLCQVNMAKLDAKNISTDARDLLLKMLAREPEERISALNALKHSFFTVSPSSKNELSEPTEEHHSKQDTIRYSFDMNNLKEANLSRSKVLDSCGSLYIPVHIPLNQIFSNENHINSPGIKERTRLDIDQEQKVNEERVSNTSSGLTSEFLEDNVDVNSTGKSSRPPCHTNDLNAQNGGLVSRKTLFSGTSPFHKAVIKNNLKKSITKCGTQEVISPGADGAVTFADYLSSSTKHTLVSVKRNSVA